MPERAIEEIAPSYVREKRLDITLASGSDEPIAFRPVLLTVSYTRTLPEGVVLPLIFEVQGPSALSYQRREFLRAAPESIIFTPREGGRHMVMLREAAHNRWFGSLRLDVAGERLAERDEA